jgi:replication factor A1
MSDVQSFASRLVEEFDDYHELDTDTVVTELTDKMDNYKLPADEAYSLLKRRYAKQADVTVEEINNETVKVNTLSTGGRKVNVEVTVVQEYDTSHENMVQSGLIGDESGTTRFTVWENNDSRPNPLDVGESYELSGVRVDEYNGQYSIKVTPESAREKLTTSIDVGDDTTTHTGVITDVNEDRSGYVIRCSHKDCTRVLDSGSCPEHGAIDDGIDDTRIIGYLLTGTETHQVVFNSDFTEELTNMSVEEATELKRDNIGAGNVVGRAFRDELLGEELTLGGFSYSDSNLFVVTELDDPPTPRADTTVDRIQELTNGGETA